MPQRGDAVDVRFTKWGGGAHWELPATYLGADGHGQWLGAPAGTVLARPGQRIEAVRAHALLFPRDGWWTGTFYERRPDDGDDEVEVYVDIATVPQWRSDGDGQVVSMIDLDLDVIRFWSGQVHLDDEDEFAEHQVSLGYPTDVVRSAQESAARLLTAVRERAEPFGRVGPGWLATFLGR